ncbi:MAG: 30S ribosomal protein S6 [Candidatus Brocadiae bacterium]|nr:30S ribosomal protein S6 [Candidatus Brocadiia bacterium]
MKGTWETMFVLEPTLAGKDWNKVVEHAHGLITRHNGEVVQSTKWGDRKLAYEIRGHKRGSYLLVYFTGPTDCVKKIDREAELSDIVVRHQILAVDRVPPPEEALPQPPAGTEKK